MSEEKKEPYRIDVSELNWSSDDVKFRCEALDYALSLVPEEDHIGILHDAIEDNEAIMVAINDSIDDAIERYIEENK